MTKESKNFEIELAQDLAAYTHDPLACVYYSFPWGTGELVGEGRDKPRDWQADTFKIIGNHLSNPATRYTPKRIARASGHGIGKSAFIAKLSHWGLSTFEDCRIIVTANTENQLRTKTMPEIIKWFGMAINKHWFTTTATSVYSNEPGHEKSWRLDAIPWSEINTEAFAGAHNVGKRLIMIFDEASKIHSNVWDTTQGALTDEGTEILWVVFGNPTQNTGSFRECFRLNRHRWDVDNIDARTVAGTNKTQIKEWEEDYGEDSDFFKIRVRGLFPNQSASQFNSDLLVDTAMKVKLKPDDYNFAPVILTLDNAWSGDDASVIGKRQGLKFEILKVIPKNDNDMEIAGLLARYEDEFGADAVFIDAGYGTGVYSFGKNLKRKWTLVWFNSSPNDPMYLNKRSEMHGEAHQWMKDGGSLPNDLEMRYELTSLETVPRNDGKIQLEGKEDAKKRGIPSPNKADALALSFAYSVKSKKMQEKAKELRKIKSAGRMSMRSHSWMG